ncbi:MAG: ABC transporter ATP-binding protein, partial [Candidatus Lokiarchaeota archaeon]|nr:ABC transporter ATP-binding protein [Candidatus Lokiarchaeota archaeon]
MIQTQDVEMFEIWSKDLTKIYGKGERAFEAVSKINLCVEPGIHGFLGPNGAGKTTTINMLVGALSITYGEAKIREKKAGSVTARKLIGFLPQDPVLYKNMSGEKYLIYMGRLGGLKRKEAKRKAQELLQDFDLLGDRNKKLGKYSGGMRQKIALAGALIHDPEILILDEPTTNLDAVGRAVFIEKIKDLGKKKSIFVSSHVLSEIEQMCEDITIISMGKIILTDSIKNLKKKFLENVFILDTNMNEKLLEQIKQKEFVSNAWIDDRDGKIRIIPKDPVKLRETMSKIIFENKAELYRFDQIELSLQDIF